MFKFMITEDSEIIFYDTESHLIFSLGLCITKLQKNWHDPTYQIINPVSFLIRIFIDSSMASYEEQFDQNLKNTHTQLSNWIMNGVGYPKIYNNYFDEEKIFKDGNYHSINTTDALWSWQSSMSTIFSGKLEHKIDSLNSQLFKTLRCPALGYVSTAANVALKSLSIMYPENYSIPNGTVLYIMNQYTNTAQYPVININGTGVTIYHGIQAEPVATTNLELAGEADKILAYYYFVDTSGNTEIPMLIYLGSSSMSSEFVKKTGDTMTGTLNVSSGNLIVNNGLIHGQNDTAHSDYTNHAIKLGHNNDDVCNFYEYGGLFNFYKSVNGTNTLLGKITTNGWEGKALLASGSTAITQAAGTNNTTVATTAFVNTELNNYVTLNTTQTITGEKIFTQPIGVTTAASIEYNTTEDCIEFNFN